MPVTSLCTMRTELKSEIMLIIRKEEILAEQKRNNQMRKIADG